MDNFRIGISVMLNQLSPIKNLIFSVIICERLLPNYEYFSQKVSWGDFQILLNAINIIYDEIYQRKIHSKEEILNAINLVESVTPDTEDYDSILASFALDTCTSIVSTLNFILDNNIENIVDSATFARDTVDMFIQEKENLSIEDNLFENIIEEDKFMIREKQRQKDVILRLLELSEVNVNIVQELIAIQPVPIIELSIVQ
jgi:uncharacterized protein